MLIFEKKYSGESLNDVEEDVYDSCTDSALVSIPTDQHGFMTGTFTVKIEWTPDET